MHIFSVSFLFLPSRLLCHVMSCRVNSVWGQEVREYWTHTFSDNWNGIVRHVRFIPMLLLFSIFGRERWTFLFVPIDVHQHKQTSTDRIIEKKDRLLSHGNEIHHWSTSEYIIYSISVYISWNLFIHPVLFCIYTVCYVMLCYVILCPSASRQGSNSCCYEGEEENEENTKKKNSGTTYWWWCSANFHCAPMRIQVMIWRLLPG